MMQERERSRASASAISGNCRVRSLPGRLEPHPRAVLAGNDAEAVVLDLMQPDDAGGRSWGFCGQARLDEAGGQGTRTQRGHGPNLGMVEAGVKLNQRH